MARSVSYPSGAIVAYTTLEPIIDDEDGSVREFDSDDFSFSVENLQSYLPTIFKSLSPCDNWVGRENHALLENKFCFVGVSEYCGLVAAWVVEKEFENYYSEDVALANFAPKWIAQNGDRIAKLAAGCFGGTALVSQGRFSNGEQVFEPVDGAQKGNLGLGFTSKEGWL